MLSLPKAVLALSISISVLLLISACVNKNNDDEVDTAYAPNPDLAQPLPVKKPNINSHLQNKSPVEDDMVKEIFAEKKLLDIRKIHMASSTTKATRLSTLEGIYLQQKFASPAAIHSTRPYAPYNDPNRESYKNFAENKVKLASEFPVSTFSVDVDTASYSNMRRMLNQGLLPSADVIRVEELLNYFSYDYPVPENQSLPFSVISELGPSPWHKNRNLLHVGLKGYDSNANALPDSNLVFLIDVSGSMRSPGKLELLIPALKMLTNQMRSQDHISIAVYAGAAGVVLESTSGTDKSKILTALDQLDGGGSTNGEAGIQLAYSLARESFNPGGVNRVILATDGDFNVGIVSDEALVALIEKERKSGISLSVLGFGRGNYNDALMQQLAQSGNGNAAYIDNINEARKVLVDELSSTLHTIASDVKIQVEFNPDVVSEYRLIGYETRHLEREDFNNDKVDAGELGAGHTVTALYEISLVGSGAESSDPLRYASSRNIGPSRLLKAEKNAEIAFIKLRYKTDFDAPSKRRSFPVKLSDAVKKLDSTSQNFRFSAAVAAFGQILRGGRYTKAFNLDDTLSLALNAKGSDEDGYRSEFISLVRTANALGYQQVSHR